MKQNEIKRNENEKLFQSVYENVTQPSPATPNQAKPNQAKPNISQLIMDLNSFWIRN